MTQDQLLAVAASWSFWDRAVPDSVPRDVLLPTELRESLCLVVQGVRRCGKSTLLRQLIGRYQLDQRDCLFVNAEDPRLDGVLRHETLSMLVEAFRSARPHGGTLYFFLDEIQGIEGWEKWLRSELDRRTGNVFVITGSNATLLSGELGSVLTGRHLTVELFPFSFDEARVATPGLRSEQYVELGGFPEPLAITDGDALLRQYFVDIVERDIRERIGARSANTVRQVLRMVCESAGAELSMRRISGAAGIAVETAASYMQAAEDAYLLFGVPFFAFSERKRLAMNRKFYPVDPGLRRAVVTASGADRGKSLECAVFAALRRHYREIYYWRGDGEVDFVVREGQEIQPIQVTWDDLKPRHEKALGSFYEAFPQAKEAITITAESFGAMTLG